MEKYCTHCYFVSSRSLRDVLECSEIQGIFFHENVSPVVTICMLAPYVLQCHLRSAVKFRDLCSLNGGVFMKVGQHIGSLEFLFPREYTDTLKCFQYEAPHSSLEDIRYVIETDTGRKMSELFETFFEEPLGAASLAQVQFLSSLLEQEFKVGLSSYNHGHRNVERS